MAQPNPYSREYNFTAFQASNPLAPIPASHLDAELNRVKTVLDQILGNLAAIQRDDTELANASVGRDQLAPEIYVGINTATMWATATAYTTSDFVFNGVQFYHCVVAHTSGTFAADIAAGKWVLLADFTAVLSTGTAVKNTAFIGYVRLTPRVPTGQFQVDPTLAAGDVKVSKDGGALANLTTLPVVTPAGSEWVRVDLSASEMNGDNIMVQFRDAAGAEWCDDGFILQTTS